jgi:hypothetical protein
MTVFASLCVIQVISSDSVSTEDQRQWRSNTWTSFSIPSYHHYHTLPSPLISSAPLPTPHPPSHSARTWCAYKFRQQTGIEQRYRTVRSKTSPKHMITFRVERRRRRGLGRNMTCLLASSFAYSVVPAILPVGVIYDGWTYRRIQTRILRTPATPENAALGISRRNSYALRMIQFVPRSKHSPLRL